MSLKVKPLGNLLLVRPKEAPQQTAGGIFLPDSASSDGPNWGEIIRKGPGKVLENGQVQPISSINEGDTVLYGNYSGTKVKVEGEDMLFIREDEIMAVVD